MDGGMKTPLGRVRGLGSAKSGTKDFWRQRLTGVAMVPLTILFVLVLVCIARSRPDEALLILRSPFVGIMMALFVGAGIVHMRLGMQVIIEDYVHGETAKIAAVMANTCFSILIGALCLYALAKLNFGL